MTGSVCSGRDYDGWCVLFHSPFDSLVRWFKVILKVIYIIILKFVLFISFPDMKAPASSFNAIMSPYSKSMFHTLWANILPLGS